MKEITNLFYVIFTLKPLNVGVKFFCIDTLIKTATFKLSNPLKCTGNITLLLLFFALILYPI